MKAPYSALYKVLEGRLIRPFERGPVKEPFRRGLIRPFKEAI